MCTHYGVSTAKIYLYNSSKNTSSRPPSGLSSEYNSVQSILVVLDHFYIVNSVWNDQYRYGVLKIAWNTMSWYLNSYIVNSDWNDPGM